MRLLLSLFLCFLGIASARAAGDEDPFAGRMEVGSFGDLTYVRNKEGAILRKRSDDDIREYVVSTVAESLKSSGLSALPPGQSDLKKAVIVDDRTVRFDVYDKNGDKLYSYVIDRESGFTEAEKAMDENRQARTRRREEMIRKNREETRRHKELLKRLETPETAKKDRK